MESEHHNDREGQETPSRFSATLLITEKAVYRFVIVVGIIGFAAIVTGVVMGVRT